MDLIFFGMQGSGKGTLGRFIAARHGMQIFETGAELRKLSQEDSKLGHKIKSIIEAGHLVPNEVVMEIVENFMNNLPKGKSVIFDGIPRKVEQAENLNALLDKHNRTYKAILLEICQETALKRLTARRICKDCKAIYAGADKTTCKKCGGKLISRTDDNPESIKTRLKAFANETVPAIEMYSDKLIKINGEPSIEEVNEASVEILDPIMK